jgi:hypothetical protein
MLPLTGGTLTGALTGTTGTFNLQAADPVLGQLNMVSPAGSVGNALIGYVGSSATVAGSRWLAMLGDGAAEAAGNVGSNFQVIRCSNAGAVIDTPLTISRASGIAAFNSSPTIPTPTAGDSSTKAASTAFVGTAITNAAVPGPATVAPVIAGVATVGTSLLYARQDHKHPTDAPGPATVAPLMDSTAAVGTSLLYARQDHVHASDTSRLATGGGTMTGALTVSQTLGIVGTTTNNNANAGAVGEVISANVTTPVALSVNGGAFNVASISLTAGDWDVSGEVWIAVGGTAAIALYGAINIASAALPVASALNVGLNGIALTSSFLINATQTFPIRTCRVSLSTTTSYFLVAVASGTTTATATGNIWARRAR